MLLAEDRRQKVNISAQWDGTGTAPAGSVVNLSAAAGSVLAVQVSGTFTATLQFEGRIAETDDVNDWFSLTGIPAAGGSTITSATAAGRWFFQYAGLRAARVRCSAYTSGTPVVTMNVSAGSSSGQAGGAASFTTVQGPLATGTTGAGNPFMIAVKDSGGLVRIVDAASVTSGVGTNLLGAGAKVFDGTNWHELKGNTDGSLPVGGFTAQVTATPTITASTYTSGFSLGGKLTLASAVRIAAGSGVIQGITVTDKAKANNAIDFLFFIAGDPTSTTFTEHAALTVNAADLVNAKAVLFPSSQYTTLATNSIGTLANIGLPFKLTTGTTLYAAAVARGGTTYASTSDLSFRFDLWQD